VGKPWLAARLTGVQVAILALAGLPLVWRFGALGACLAVLLATGAGLLLVLRRLDAVAPGAARELVGPALAALLALAGAIALRNAPQVGALGLALRVSLEMGCAAALFALVLVAARPRQARERLAYVWRLARADRE
jgi:O-antigen/teichoic acid export membrane protein